MRLRCAVVMIGMAIQTAAPEEPARILQIHREALKPGSVAAYGSVEEDITRICLELECPHPYLGIESLTGPKEVWYFNGYGSAAEQKKVSDDYAKNERLLTRLTEASNRKAAFTHTPVNVFATYRQDVSRGTPWLLGRGRFLVIAVTKSHRSIDGTVFEALDGTRFVVLPARTRDRADALAAATGPEAMIFAVRPTWSTPAKEWVEADPQFWQSYPPAVRP
jgi:hypothetical protein